MSGVVLNPIDETSFNHHFDIKVCTLSNSLGFYFLADVFEIFHSIYQFFSDVFNGGQHFLARSNEMFGRENSQFFDSSLALPPPPPPPPPPPRRGGRAEGGD